MLKMLKKSKITILFIFSAVLFASAAVGSFVPETKDSGFISSKIEYERLKITEKKSEFSWRKHEGTPLPEHEKLTFTVMWNFIAVGEASLELRGYDYIEGRKAHHVYSYAKTKPFFDTFFKVRDTNESWIDEESKASLRYKSDISEGGWLKNEVLDFDHIGKTFLLYDNGKMQKGKIPEYVQDVLSALYYVRTMDIKTGDSITLDAHSGDLSWPLTIKVLKKDKIKVPAGEFNCFLLEPVIRKEAGIVNAKGKMQVWVTADEKKMPVCLKVKIPIGSANAVLERFEVQKNIPILTTEKEQ